MGGIPSIISPTGEAEEKKVRKYLIKVGEYILCSIDFIIITYLFVCLRYPLPSLNLRNIIFLIDFNLLLWSLKQIIIQILCITLDSGWITG